MASGGPIFIPHLIYKNSEKNLSQCHFVNKYITVLMFIDKSRMFRNARLLIIFVVIIGNVE
jgi:hypothetical protein